LVLALSSSPFKVSKILYAMTCKSWTARTASNRILSPASLLVVAVVAEVVATLVDLVGVIVAGAMVLGRSMTGLEFLMNRNCESKLLLQKMEQQTQ
jgi:hypothetical protein